MLNVTVTHRQRYPNITRSVQSAAVAIAAHSRQVSMSLTSGTVSSAQLAAEGHPFGRMSTGTRRRGRMRGNRARLPINKQRGDLQKSLTVKYTSAAKSLRVTTQFTAPYASYVLAFGGTRTMVARGFWAEWAKQMMPLVHRELRSAFSAYTVTLKI